MKTSKRFDNAVAKLYTAFHNKTLNPDDCKQCAVGNILNNTDQWQHITDKHGTVSLNYVGLVNQRLERRFNGYTPLELLRIETAFLKGCGYLFSSKKRLHKPENINDDSVLFNGLCEVVSELCRLEHINNVMDCSELFNFEKKPVGKILVA